MFFGGNCRIFTKIDQKLIQLEKKHSIFDRLAQFETSKRGSIFKNISDTKFQELEWFHQSKRCGKFTATPKIHEYSRFYVTTAFDVLVVFTNEKPQ